MKIFGFNVGKTKDDALASPVPSKDSSIEITSNAYGHLQGGIVGLSFNYENNVKHRELVRSYRELARKAECEYAIDEITSEMADFNESIPFELRFKDGHDISKKLQDKIFERFNEVAELYSVDLSSDIRKWYIDGSRVWFIQLEKDGKTIRSLRNIEPWMIRKVTPTQLIQTADGITTYKEEEPYYVYSQEEPSTSVRGSTTTSVTKEIKLAHDSIVYIDSGKYNDEGTPLSYIGAALKPINDLMSLENAAIIYRLTRAPEKRAIYVDTGQLPTAKAEEYVNSLMKRFKTKLDYNSQTGEVTTANQNVIAATVDYFLPRREGSTGTEVSLLSETSNAIANITEEIEYFRKKTYTALKLPKSRIDENPGFSLGQSGQISREEVKFSQFMELLKDQYTHGLYHLLGVSLVLNNDVSTSEWEEIYKYIGIEMISNDFFAESKKLEVLQERLNSLSSINDYVGTYYSREYVFKEILNMTDEEIEIMKKQMESEPQPDPEE